MLFHFVLLTLAIQTTPTVDPATTIFGIDPSVLVAAIGTHQWTLVIALVIGGLVFASKTPLLASWFNKVPMQYRPLVVIALGFLTGVQQALMNHKAWTTALVTGLIAALAAIGGDQAITKAIIPIAKSMRKLPSKPVDLPVDPPTQK